MPKKKKWYAVRAGYRTGVFETWDDCKLQVDGFKGAAFKAFDSQDDALAFLGDAPSNDAASASHAKPDMSPPMVVCSVRPDYTTYYNRHADGTSAEKRGRDVDSLPAGPALKQTISGSDHAHAFAHADDIASHSPPSRCDGLARAHPEFGGPEGERAAHALLQAHLLRAKLSDDQRRVCELADSGCNIFLTGLGGTGKSHVLQLLVKFLRQKWGGGSRKAGRSAVVLASSTGVSAVSIGGVTLHSLAGCGVPRFAVHFERVWSRKSVWNSMKVRRARLQLQTLTSFRTAQVLVLDEVSMIQVNHRHPPQAPPIAASPHPPSSGRVSRLARPSRARRPQAPRRCIRRHPAYIRRRFPSSAALSCCYFFSPSAPSVSRRSQLPGVASNELSLARPSAELKSAATLARETAAASAAPPKKDINWAERIPIGAKEFCAPAFASQAWRDAGFVSAELTTM